MLVARLGSLNALEQTREGRGVWCRLFGKGHRVPSADTLARVQALFDPEDVRTVLAGLYARLKRGKALPAPHHGLLALVIDGHESTASYLRSCSGCLQREIKTKSGTRTQYYHRWAVAMLVGEGVEIFLDVEPQRPGESEVGAASRLLRRVHQRYPRAFDVVLADALYAQRPFFREVLALGKDAMAVLKNEDQALVQEVRSLCEIVPPKEHTAGSTRRTCWDLSDLPWDADGQMVRVVRSEETTTVRRQLTKEEEETFSSWMWVSTLSSSRASTRTVIDLGHRRWAIENEGFNEGVNAWYMDHVYHHEPRAMEVMLLLVMLAYNLLHIFYDRNLKPAVRQRLSLQHIGREVTAEIYITIPPSRAPP